MPVNQIRKRAEGPFLNEQPHHFDFLLDGVLKGVSGQPFGVRIGQGQLFLSLFNEIAKKGRLIEIAGKVHRGPAPTQIGILYFFH
jgi:hypothetical protein